MTRKHQLKILYSNFKDQALKPDDPFYVDFLARSNDDPIATLSDHIDLDEGRNVHLLSGPRGTGKSTEIQRLSQILEQAGHRVLYCDMEHYLNMSDAP